MVRTNIGQKEKATPEVTVSKPPVKTKTPPGSKSERDKITRLEAIKLQCWECMGYQKGSIKDCPDLGCPLWTFRLGTQVHSDIPVRKPQPLKKAK